LWAHVVGDEDVDGPDDGDGVMLGFDDEVGAGDNDGGTVGTIDGEGDRVGIRDDDGWAVGTGDGVGKSRAQLGISNEYTSSTFPASKTRPESW
jgi:hypothetical protein